MNSEYIGKKINSFKYAIDGLKFAYKFEQSMTLHLITTLSFVILGLIFSVSLFEWAIIFMLLGMIAAIELINTSLEAVVDVTSEDYHILAKIGKDTASGAVFVISSSAFIVFCIMFIPRILGM